MEPRKTSTAKSASSRSRSKGSKKAVPISQIYTDGPLLSGRISYKTTNKGSQGCIPKKRSRPPSQTDNPTKPNKLKHYINPIPAFFKNHDPPSRQPQRKKMTPVHKRSEEKIKSPAVHHTEAINLRSTDLPHFQFKTHQNGRTNQLSEVLERQTGQKLPVDILQNLEWLKMNSERNREIVSGRRGLRVSLRQQYDQISRSFGRSVMLNGKKVQSCSNSLERPKEEWNENVVPLKPEEVLMRFPNLLTRDQKKQIKQYEQIYFIGHKARKREKIGEEDVQYDTPDFQYRYVLNDHIAYRYEILQFLGKGSYGQVFKVFDHKDKHTMALKIIKNKKRYADQAKIQIRILLKIKQHDPDNLSGIVKIMDFQIFRNHTCIIFELLCQNLYELIKKNNYNGLDIELIRRIAIQILNSLKFLKERRIIHCDLKPQNILLKNSNMSGIKIIDFGSSCFQKQIIYSYIQSRYYRAPEVTFQIKYNTMIDMWSFGCILAQLYLGQPLFPGDNEFQQMNYMVSTLGKPPKDMLDNSLRGHMFFDQDGQPTDDMKEARLTPNFGHPLHELIDQQHRLFLQFLETILKWNPRDRPTPQQALRHPWIMEGLPQDIRNMKRLFEDDRPKRTGRIFVNQSKEFKKKPRSREKDNMADSKSKSKQSKSKSRSKEISLRIKQPFRSDELRRESNSIPVKIKVNLETKVKLKAEQPKIHIQINKGRRERDFFRDK